MNGDILKDVRQSEPVHPSARRHNLINRVVREHFRNQIPQDGALGPQNNGPCDIPVHNNTTNAISQYGILGIDSPIVAPSNSASVFQSQGVFVHGVTPVSVTHSGKFVIAQEPIAPQGVGTCRIAGASLAQVGISSTNDATCDISPGSVTQLVSGVGGSQILWSASNSAGLQWCIVRLGGNGLPSGQYRGQVLQLGADNTSGTYSWVFVSELFPGDS